jgi:chromosomal replication initiator protein
VIPNIWEHFLTIAREEAGSRVVETWFKAVKLARWDSIEKVVYLKAPNAFVQKWINDNYIPLLCTHLGRLLNVTDIRVVFVEDSTQAETIAKEEPHYRAAALIKFDAENTNASTEKKATALVKTSLVGHCGNINRTYSFDTFVVGPSNSLSYAAAHAVTEKPGRLYNPLFIYGGSGLGKTHLLHAIGNEIKEKNKKATILYQTADRFVNEFINAIRFNKIHKFQQKYQAIDVLLVDDIQFIANKEQTQEAFFHIFNVLYEAHKQIVFSSDVVPNNMSGMAERLRSRLAWGLVTDIHVPRLETKIAILKKKAELSNSSLADDVAHFIASRVTSNIRELEGALIRVMAFASLTNKAVTLDLAKRVLAHASSQEEQPVDFDRIINGLSKYYSYSLKDFRSKNRNKELAFVRQLAMFLMKRLTDKSLRDIGSFLGGRNHATVMHAIHKIEEQVKSNPDFAHKLKNIESGIRAQ